MVSYAELYARKSSLYFISKTAKFKAGLLLFKKLFNRIQPNYIVNGKEFIFSWSIFKGIGSDIQIGM